MSEYIDLGGKQGFLLWKKGATNMEWEKLRKNPGMLDLNWR